MHDGTPAAGLNTRPKALIMPKTVRPPLERAAIRTIAAYRAKDLLTDEHRLTERLILETVEALPLARPGQQRAAMIKELRELVGMLPGTEPEDDPAAEFLKGL